MTQPPGHGFPPGIQNTIHGTVTSPTVQAGIVHGGVHYHVNHSAARPARLRSVVWAWLWTWLAVLPQLIVCAGIGGLIDAAVPAPAPFAVKLLLDLILLAIGALIVAIWAFASGRQIGGLLAAILDRCTPGRMAALSDGTLLVVLAVLCPLWLGGLATEVARAPAVDGRGGDGALLVVGFLAVVAGRLVWRRRTATRARFGPGI
jgi:ABC-type sugar transport system permease subunit